MQCNALMEQKGFHCVSQFRRITAATVAIATRINREKNAIPLADAAAHFALGQFLRGKKRASAQDFESLKGQMAEMEDDFMTEFEELHQLITKRGSNDSTPNEILKTDEYADCSGRWINFWLKINLSSNSFQRKIY